jgi:zinc D-Ala-D-Ala carboxypeptidase
MAIKEYAHWSDVDVAEFRRRWPNFSPQEIACKGTGSLKVNDQALTALQRLRTALGKPLILTSAFRSKQHNKNVGGATNSQHLEGAAFDVRMENHDPEAFEKAARAAGFTGFGYYPNSGFMHVDIGPARTWGTPFPKRRADIPVFAAEPEPRPVLTTGTGRSAIGGISMAVTAIATAAPQLMEVAQHPLANVVPWVGSALAVIAIAAFVISIIRKSGAERLEPGEQ